MPRIPVLTIDGPSGSGKGTISRAVAERLGWHYLDSGALYRAVGLAAAWESLDLSDAEAVAQCAARTEIRFESQGGGDLHVIVNGKDATHQLRMETAGAAASAIAAHPRSGLRWWTCSTGSAGPRAWSPTAGTWARSSSRTPRTRSS